METPENNPEHLDAILQDAEVLARADALNAELRALAAPQKGMLSYYDTDRVEWSANAYDVVFFDNELNLRHAKIEPQQLKIPGDLHERESVEQMLADKGFVLDESEKFRSALHRQLN